MRTLDRKWLTQAIKAASTAVNKRSPKPVLTKVLVTASDGVLGVHGTDTELSVSAFQQIGHGVPERFLLPPIQALQFLDSSDAEVASVSADVGKVTLKCDRSEITFNTEDPLEYPSLKIEPPEDVTKVDGKLLQQGIRRTLYAADEDSSRFALGSILLSDSADGLLCVATDGRRLSRATVEAIAVGGLSSNQSLLLPVKAAKAILSMSLDEAWLWVNGNSICLADSDTRFSTRMVEGRYPNWSQVIPALDGYQAVKTSREPLLRMLKQASIVANTETRGVDLSVEDGTLEAKSSSADVGSSDITMPVEYDGEPVTVKLDYGFLKDFFEPADEDATLFVKNSRSPVIVRSGDRYDGVLMPMALDG